MGLEFSFKGYGEVYMSRIHPGIRLTHVIISWGRKPTTTNALFTSLSLAGGRERVLGNYSQGIMCSRELRERGD